LKTVGSYWPYATTLWDYIRRAMPFDHPGTLTDGEIYGATAYVLFMNGIVAEHDEVNETASSQILVPMFRRSGDAPTTAPCDVESKP
jgi:S-disulfanyl-L-cysteine oxidoreductase SoxD